MKKIEFKVEDRSIVFMNEDQNIVVPVDLLKQKLDSPSANTAYSRAMLETVLKPGITVVNLYTLAAIIQKCYPDVPWDWEYHFCFYHIMFDVEELKNKFLKFKGEPKWPRFKSNEKKEMWQSEFETWLDQSGLIKTDDEYASEIAKCIKDMIYTMAKSDFIDVSSIISDSKL
jgi:hypothetical protein